MTECDYCEAEYSTDEQLTAHLADTHDREELSPIDQRRVEQYEQESPSRLQRLTGDRRLSRRATLAAVGVGIVGGAVGLGGSALGQSGPTEISDWNDLNDVRENLDASYELVNDLDGTTAGYNTHVSDPVEGFEPIDGFTGEFDGNGNDIADLVIDRVDESNVGLFGDIEDAEIRNLTLADVDVTLTDDGNFPNVLGGLVGFVKGDTAIENCAVEGGTVTADGEFIANIGGLIGQIDSDDTVVEDCHATCDVDGSDTVAGLIGRIDGNSFVRRCYATGDVSATAGNLGGLVASIPVGAGIEESFSACDISGGTGFSNGTGGICGYMNRSASAFDTYALGDVTGTEEETKNIGGLAGRMDEAGFDGIAGPIDTSIAIGEVSTGSNEGGIVGQVEDDGFGGPEVDDSYWDTVTTTQADAVGDGPEDDNVDATGLDTEDLQGDEASLADAVVGDLDFDGVWETVSADDEDATEDGYPILQAIDREVQLDVQGILETETAVRIEGENMTISNVTVEGGNDD